MAKKMIQFICLAQLVTSIADARTPVALIVGDSLTMGVMSYTQVGQSRDIFDSPRAHWLADWIAGWRTGIDPFGKKAMNTKRMDRFGWFGFAANSWIRGTLVNSVAKRLRHAGLPLRFTDFSRPGLTFLQAEQRIEEKKSLAKLDDEDIKLVVVNLGLNDFFLNMDLDTFHFQVKKTFASLKNIAPEAKFVVTGLLPVVDIFVNGRHMQARSDGMTCADVLNKLTTSYFGEETALRQQPDNPKVVAQERERLEQMQRILHQEAKSHNAFFAPMRFDMDLTKFIARDCLHPSRDGHRMIAEDIWPVFAQAFGL